MAKRKVNQKAIIWLAIILGIFFLLNSWAIPFTVLISKEREIVLRHTGYLSGDEKFLQKEIEFHLQNKK